MHSPTIYNIINSSLITVCRKKLINEKKIPLQQCPIQETIINHCDFGNGKLDEGVKRLPSIPFLCRIPLSIDRQKVKHAVLINLLVIFQLACTASDEYTSEFRGIFLIGVSLFFWKREWRKMNCSVFKISEWKHKKKKKIYNTFSTYLCNFLYFL